MVDELECCSVSRELMRASQASKATLCCWKDEVGSACHSVHLSLQVFYRTHIIAFVAFIAFGFMHHYQLWAYTMPGEAHF